MNARKQLIVSLAFLFSSVALWHKVVPQTPPDFQPPVTTFVTISQDSIEGAWEQYSLEGEQPEFMARLNLRRQSEDYLAYPEVLSPTTYPKHAYRSFEHEMQGDRWTFKEEWGHGVVGTFELEKTRDGSYVGVAHGSDGHCFKTLFTRVR